MTYKNGFSLSRISIVSYNSKMHVDIQMKQYQHVPVVSGYTKTQKRKMTCKLSVFYKTKKTEKLNFFEKNLYFNGFQLVTKHFIIIYTSKSLYEICILNEINAICTKFIVFWL